MTDATGRSESRYSFYHTTRRHIPEDSDARHMYMVTAVAQWLRCCATNRKVTGSIPAGVIGIFH